jgi:Ca2+-binding EF-hand superfamily protein
MSENNQKCTDTEIQDWINEFDIDGDGAINFPEFMSMMAKYFNPLL